MNCKPPKQIEVFKNIDSGYSELTLKQLFYIKKYVASKAKSK